MIMMIKKKTSPTGNWTPVVSSILTQGKFRHFLDPLGDVLSMGTDKDPGAVKAEHLLVYDAQDGNVAPPVDVVVDSRYNTKKERRRGFFQYYRCVHKRYLKDDQSIKFFMSIIDHYDPAMKYDRTFLWTFSTDSDQPSDTDLFMSANTIDHKMDQP